MTDYTKPLTDQVENGAELEAAAQIVEKWYGASLGSTPVTISARRLVINFERYKERPNGSSGSLPMLAEARRQIAILDGDAIANARNEALEEAAVAAESACEGEYEGDHADNKHDIARTIRALKRSR